MKFQFSQEVCNQLFIILGRANLMIRNLSYEKNIEEIKKISDLLHNAARYSNVDSLNIKKELEIIKNEIKYQEKIINEMIKKNYSVAQVAKEYLYLLKTINKEMKNFHHKNKIKKF